MIRDPCAICFEEIKDADENQRAVLDCSHEFHPACLLKWFKRNVSCPKCRQSHQNQSLSETSRYTFNHDIHSNPIASMRRVRRIIVDEDDTENNENIPPINLNTHFSISSDFASLTWPEIRSIDGFPSPSSSHTDSSLLSDHTIHNSLLNSDMLYTLLSTPSNRFEDDMIPEVT